MADWTDWADGSDLAGMSRSTSPLSSAGIDPDELRANPAMRQQIMAAISTPYGLSALQKPAATPVAGPPSAPSPAPAAPASPRTMPSPAATPASPGSVQPGSTPTSSAAPMNTGAGARQNELDEMASQALQKGLQLGGFAQKTAADLTAPPDPRIEQLQEEQLKDSTPTPYKDASGKPLPQYAPTGWQRFGRGLKAAALGFAEGGPLGAVGGAIDPELIRGGTAYGAPNAAYETTEAQRQGRLANETQELGDLQDRFKQMTDARKAAVDAAKTGAGAYSDVLSGVKNLETQAANQKKNETTLRKAGFKLDDQGNIVPLDRSEMSPQDQVRADLNTALEEQAEARAAVLKAQNDPNSPAYRLAIQRANTANANAAAAMERAQAYALNATGANLGTDTHGKTLSGATILPSGSPVGSRFQTSVQKHESNVAQFNDVLGATDNLENTARRLVAKGGKGALSDSIIAAALAEPEGTFGKWMQGQMANGRMTPEQRDYVTNLRAYRENLQALRKSAGGGVSDSQVDRLMEMAPGAATPDLDYLLRQTGQIRATANRLSKGIPEVEGGTKVEVEGAPTAPPGGAPAKDWAAQFPKAN